MAAINGISRGKEQEASCGTRNLTSRYDPTGHVGGGSVPQSLNLRSLVAEA